MKQKTHSQNTGITLIEMMVSLGLLIFFSVFLVALVVTSQQALSVEQTSAPVRIEAKRALEAIVKELRAADPSTPTPGGVTIGGSGTSQSITFYIPNTVAQTGISSWRQIQITHDAGTQEIIRTEGGTSAVLGNNVSSLQFSQVNNIVTATIGTIRTLPGGSSTISFSLSGQARLRN